MPTSVFDFTNKSFDPIGGANDPLCGPGVFGQTLQPGFSPEYKWHSKGLKVTGTRAPGTSGILSAGFHIPIKLAEFIDLPRISLELEFDGVRGKRTGTVPPAAYAWAVVVLAKAGNQFWRYRSDGADADAASVATCQFRANATTPRSTRLNLPGAFNSSVNTGTQANVPLDIFDSPQPNASFVLKMTLDNSIAGSTLLPIAAHLDFTLSGGTFTQMMSGLASKFVHEDMDKISFVGANIAMANGDGEFSARFKKLTITT